MPIELGTVSYSLAAILFLCLIITQIRIWERGKSSSVLLFANVFTLFWCICLLYIYSFTVQWFYLVVVLEITKYLSWFILLLSVMGIRRAIHFRELVSSGSRGLVTVAVVTLAIPMATLLFAVYLRFLTENYLLLPDFGSKNIIMGILITAITGLALLEQVVRNTRSQHLWHLKYLVLGLAILFSYDVYLYSLALLFEQLDSDLWQIRGLVTVIAVPLIAVGVIRTRQTPIQVNITRRLVFHTSVLLASGLYLLLIAAGGFYIRNSSSQWGDLIQIIFWVLSAIVLLVLIYSGRLRSKIRLYISRNLFSSKYDYRDEWMRITRTLSQTSSNEPLTNRSILALAEIIDSTGGGLWLTRNGAHYDQVAEVELGWLENSTVRSTDFLISYLSTNQIVDFANLPSGLDTSKLPPWLARRGKVRLVVPLELHGELIGFIALKEFRVEMDLNWEDYDLLKAAGQQAASYLAQMIASDALSEAKQFSAFNQGSAFVVHDIKTVNSQLALLVKNASKFKNNQSFVEDMIRTADHAVKKMNFLLEHFKQSKRDDGVVSDSIDLTELIKNVIEYQSTKHPVPKLTCDDCEMHVVGNRSDLQAALGHIIQNAQEATTDDGKVDVYLVKNDTHANVLVSDSGTGMTQEFIQTRLFKPFETTKGLTGMGIGVFQARETLRKLGGDIEVRSNVGEGSEFTVSIPLAQNKLSKAADV